MAWHPLDLNPTVVLKNKNQDSHQVMDAKIISGLVEKFTTKETGQAIHKATKKTTIAKIHERATRLKIG